MDIRIKFDVLKCAELNIDEQAFGFWDRKEGRAFFLKKILPYVNVLNIGDTIKFDEYCGFSKLSDDF